MINIVLFGKPGAGKGTQAEFLKDKYNLVHISTGDVFRYNLKNNTELGKQAKAFMDKGDLVPDELTIKMLQDEVEKNIQATGFFVRWISQNYCTGRGFRPIFGIQELECNSYCCPRSQ